VTLRFGVTRTLSQRWGIRSKWALDVSFSLAIVADVLVGFLCFRDRAGAKHSNDNTTT
jgi:hypothetical protein